MMQRTISTLVFALAFGEMIFAYDGFTNPVFWSTFDAGANGVGTDPDGFAGAVFDGRYIYFSPQFNGTDFHGEVLRYDTANPFGAAASWASFDPGSNGVGTDADGYEGAVFDGRFVYFVPYRNGTPYPDFHSEVLRYDTLAPFDAASSWAAYDPAANGVGVDAEGFNGGVFDGRYVYFVPRYNGADYNGEVLRYDTTAMFAAAISWEAYDPGANGVGADPDGFGDAVFDGRYVYFIPNYDGTEASGEVLRYDTTFAFSTSGSWLAYDPSANGIGTDADGYYGAVFDGRYIYFSPNHNGISPHGEVLRFDTAGPFASPSSWLTFDPGANGVGTNPRGYAGAAFDGRYVYFAPGFNGADYHGEVLRYDVTLPFATVAAWRTFDPGGNGVGTDADGFNGAAFDGRFLYFCPKYNGTEQHGEVLRYDTLVAGTIPAVSEWGVAVLSLLFLVAGTMVVRRATHHRPT